MQSNSDLRNAVYFHGLPGSPDELALAIVSAKLNLRTLPPLDILAFDDFVRINGKVHIIAFSLGAFTALQIAASRPDDVSKITLISPAGPLELGDFLESMAGAPIFKLARDRPLGLAFVTAIQASLSYSVPKLLLTQMFSGSCEAEKALLKDPKIIKLLISGLRSSFWHNSQNYKRVLCQYVEPWANCLQHLRCPVSIYHGECDNWSPLAMSQALVAELSENAELFVKPNLGHYSTLIEVLPKILNPVEIK